MIDHTLLKPAAVVVLAGFAAAALTVGQSAFASGPAAARARAAPAACDASGPAIYTPPASVYGAPGDLRVTAASFDGGPFRRGLHSADPDMPFTALLDSTGRAGSARPRACA
jgi:hypothetical protein